MTSLPIDCLLPDVVASLGRGSCLVVRAAPGAGKTTRVPAALLDAGIAGAKDIVVLEPRRIAARAAAEFVARERGGTTGGEIGYRVRFEQRGGSATRLWFVTEGSFTRRLITDPFLESVGIVILDEFHERHLQGDVALAAVRELQGSVRPELKLVVMSATLETASLAAALPDATVLTSEGRSHPVAVEYLDPAAPDLPLHQRVARAIESLVANRAAGVDEREGDILVFLPGAAEIRRAGAALESTAQRHGIEIATLHGDLPLDAQQRVLRAGSRRRIVLTTNVAETALTVDGVTTVIDSGLARIARLDRRHGINRLRVAPISRAAADQRAGRAARTAPGRCVRLWTHADHVGRREYETPEVLRLDLARTVLELRGWGLQEPRSLAWLDAPSEVALESAERLLTRLGALGDDGGLTETGRRMLELPVSPRIGAILVEAERRGCHEDAAVLAALATERDICLESRTFAGGGGGDGARWPAGPSDLLLRRDLFEDARRRGLDAHACRAVGLEPRAVRTVERSRRQLLRLIRGRRGRGTKVEGPHATQGARSEEADALLRCLLVGFPDRVARRRAPESSRAVMVGARGVVLSEQSIVRDDELFVAVDVERVQREARVRLASAVRVEWLREQFPDAMRRATELVFDPARERVVQRTRELYHDLVLSEAIRLDVHRADAGVVLAREASAQPERAARIGDEERLFLARIAFLREALPDLGLPPDTDALLIDAVASLCANRVSFAELRAAPVLRALKSRLTPAQITALEREAPTHWPVPGGRRAPLDYERGKAPTIAARIQELFGQLHSPRVARGRVPILIYILAPNHRPVQITDDLESFWQKTYPEVRKQLRGRYPKHEWPDDPLHARPSSRPGRRRHSGD